jgi:hypothetical protein
VIRRLKKGVVSYGRGTAISLEPIRRKTLFEIKTENFQGLKNYTNKSRIYGLSRFKNSEQKRFINSKADFLSFIGNPKNGCYGIDPCEAIHTFRPEATPEVGDDAPVR